MGFAEKKLFFVTGKGGVGKTTVATGLARSLARAGRKVLLVELGAAGSWETYFGLSRVGYQPAPTKLDGLWVARWTGEECLKDYVLHFLKVSFLYDLFFQNHIMRALLDVAPGLWELSIMGKWTSGLRGVGPSFSWDAVVMDAYSTGHALTLLKAARGMAEAIRLGPMAEQSRGIHETLCGGKQVEFLVCCLPEELAAREGLELAQEIESFFAVSPLVVCNRVLCPPSSLAKVNPQEHPEAGQFLQFVSKRVQTQTEYVELLEKRKGRTTMVPHFFESAQGDLLQKVSEVLANDLL